MHYQHPSDSTRDEAAWAALARDVAADCGARLARVAGTHGLLLDGLPIPIPAFAGLACWTALHPGPVPDAWEGPLQLEVSALPFADASFCAVLVRFTERLGHQGVAELARVLAPHGTLLVAGMHPGSFWRGGRGPGPWERALRGAGLDVLPAVRCGAPWPRNRGADGLPHWLVHGLGGAWIVEARHSVLATLPLRKAMTGHRALEQGALVPGARRACA